MTTGRGAFVPLTFAPGEAFQFDWSEDWAVIGGERTKLQVAQFKLAYSRAFLLRAYALQTHEMLFDAHNHAFRVLGGVPQRGIYDNMKTAVDKIKRGKARGCERTLPSHGQSLCLRGRVLQSGIGLGKRPN
jgi:transposase